MAIKDASRKNWIDDKEKNCNWNLEVNCDLKNTFIVLSFGCCLLEKEQLINWCSIPFFRHPFIRNPSYLLGKSLFLVNEERKKKEKEKQRHESPRAQQRGKVDVCVLIILHSSTSSKKDTVKLTLHSQRRVISFNFLDIRSLSRKSRSAITRRRSVGRSVWCILRITRARNTNAISFLFFSFA